MTTRVRSRTLYANPLLHEVAYSEPGHSLISDKGTPSSKSISETMTDEVSPGYFSKAKRGQFLPINDMDHSTTTFVAETGQVDFDVKYNGNPAYTTQWDGTLGWSAHMYHKGDTLTPSYSGLTPSWPSTSPVLTEALANARTRGFDILTFMAEFRKTIELIARFRDRTLKRASKVADSLGKSADPVSAFAETWLEARYGWRILIYDIESINEAISKLQSFRPPFIRGYAGDENSTSTLLDYAVNANMRHTTPNSPPTLYGRARIITDQVKTRQVRCGVVLEALLDDIFEVDPLVTGWEVIPFSFIIDWFVNVGDVIAAYSPFATENLLGAWSKTTETLTTTCTTIPGTTGNPSSGWYYESSNTTPVVCVTTNVTEHRQSESPSANLSFKVNLDELKLLDLASIFITRYAGLIGGILKSNRI